MNSRGELAVATLIGDVIGSRQAEDRGELHERLVEVLTAVNDNHHPLDPLRITAGDEFQGRWSTVGQALDAALAIRIGLLPTFDARFGVGWGSVTVFDSETGAQDGPGWWSARAAIHWVEEAQETSGMSGINTAYRTSVQEAPAEGPVNAALHVRDFVLGQLDSRSLRILRGLMSGWSQVKIAQAEGVSPSAISQRYRSDGLAVLMSVHEALRDIK